MEYRVIRNLKVKAQGVEKGIPAGAVITMAEAQAARLVKAGKVVPLVSDNPLPVQETTTDPQAGPNVLPTTPDLPKVSLDHEPPRPYLDPEGDPVIPFKSDPKYHWWAGGQPLSDTFRELWEERAAIREYEGGQTREEAERGAMEDIQRMRARMN